jgi:thiol-disulfide isomerase/thioredoxin
MEGLRSIDLLKSDVHLRPKLDPTGTLEMEGVKLTGRLVDSGDSPIVAVLSWKPLLGESSSPLRPGASGRIDYKPPAPIQSNQPQAARAQPNNVVGALINVFRPAAVNQPAARVVKDKRMIYLRTGDIIPAEILKIDEKGVTFRTELSLSSFVPHERIKAVEMGAEFPSSIKLNKTKFERLMMLPRMQRDSPPTQLIRSKNGDILRGRILSMDDTNLRVEIRLEEKEIARDRISRIIWLHADETDPKKKPAPLAEADLMNRVQAVRSDGIRLTYNADKFAEDTLSGSSDVLGECKVRMQDVDELLIGGSVEKVATQLAYQNWKLQNAPDPKSAQDDDASPSGSAGTESSLVGKPAPDFTLDLLDGKKFHLADHKGKVVVLDFWATWCGPCLQAMPQVERATHEFADKGVELIAVNLQETPDKIKALLERQKLTPTVALDRDGVVAQRYQANAIPQTVVIDREGKITRLFIGSTPKLGDQLKEALQALMPEAKP